VHASTATCISRPRKRLAHRVTAAGVASIRPRITAAESVSSAFEGDLRSMHIKPGYDRHQALL
jgi:hypothetical protein